MNTLQQRLSCLEGYDPSALDVDKACEAIRACLTPGTPTERVALREALGRVLAEDIVPAIDVPAHDNSAMDGYAVRSADLAPGGETALREIGSALAGRPFKGRVGAGECVRVMTGAVLPQGTDTVVIQEVARAEGDRILFPPGQKRAQNVRYAGEDLKTGVPVLQPGALLCPADLGLIASLGIGQVRVRRRLRVAFFATGDELASLDQPADPSALAAIQVSTIPPCPDCAPTPTPTEPAPATPTTQPSSTPAPTKTTRPTATYTVTPVVIAQKNPVLTLIPTRSLPAAVGDGLPTGLILIGVALGIAVVSVVIVAYRSRQKIE